MKTEKFSFGKIKDILSRDEMKQIVAGCGGCTVTSGEVAGCHNRCWKGANNHAYEICMLCCKAVYCGQSCA